MVEDKINELGIRAGLGFKVKIITSVRDTHDQLIEGASVTISKEFTGTDESPNDRLMFQ